MAYAVRHALLAVEPMRFRNAGVARSALLFRERGPSNTSGVPEMCDYSLQNVRSRPAKVGDKLTTRDFGTVTRGFAAAEDARVAVCVLPGTELAFANAVAVARPRFIGWKVEKLGHTTAIFRQVNKNEPMQHHDALEFPDGRIFLLTQLCSGQEATVLQLPAQPMTVAEAEAQKRVAPVG